MSTRSGGDDSWLRGATGARTPEGAQETDAGAGGIRRDGLAVDRTRDVLPQPPEPRAAGQLVEVMSDAVETSDMSTEGVRVLLINSGKPGSADHVILANDGEALRDFWVNRAFRYDYQEGLTYTVKVREMTRRELYAFLYEPKRP